MEISFPKRNTQKKKQIDAEFLIGYLYVLDNIIPSLKTLVFDNIACLKTLDSRT